MQPHYALRRTRHAAALREADERRAASRRATCRRRVLGLAIGPACTPTADRRTIERR